MLISSLFVLATTAVPQGPDYSTAGGIQYATTVLHTTSGLTDEILTIDLATARTDPIGHTASSFHELQEAAETSKKRSGFYVGMDLGISLVRGTTTDLFSADQRLKFEDSAVFGGAVGYRLNNHWRLEANINYRQTDIDTIDNVTSDGDMSLTTYMANVYFDLDLEGVVKPYIGFGTGIGSYKLTTPSASDDDDSGFASNLLFGASCRLADNIDLNICYRRLTVSSLFNEDLETQDFLIGVRYSF